MIRKTLETTQLATFCIKLPSTQHQGMSAPIGTGFFIAPDGWFVTAAHVITQDNQSEGPIRQDIDKAWLMKETRLDCELPGALCQGVSFGHLFSNLDFALLKVDFGANSNKAWLKDKTEFPYITVSSSGLQEGEAVYSFGYPLSSAFAQSIQHTTFATTSLCPRVTSAIVSSTLEKTAMIMSGADPQVYVLDKALNYGNSGGPIVAVDTGHVHAFCSRFQPLSVPQLHLKNDKGDPLSIYIPSLYGVVSSLRNKQILELMISLDVPVESA